MIILIEGKEKSGKSRLAESIFRALDKKGYYIATMIPYGDYGNEIIKRHRILRDDLELTTVESPYLDDVSVIEEGSSVILEDVSNLVANRFFNKKEQCNEYVEDIEKLAERCSELIIVGMCDIDEDNYDEETGSYIHEMNTFMDYLEKLADTVIYVENGIGQYIKGQKLKMVRKEEE